MDSSSIGSSLASSMGLGDFTKVGVGVGNAFSAGSDTSSVAFSFFPSDFLNKPKKELLCFFFFESISVEKRLFSLSFSAADNSTEKRALGRGLISTELEF